VVGIIVTGIIAEKGWSDVKIKQRADEIMKNMLEIVGTFNSRIKKYTFQRYEMVRDFNTFDKEL